MNKPEYRRLVALLDEAEDISLEQCKRNYTPGNERACYGGVWAMTFKTAQLARGEGKKARELRGIKVRLVIR